MERRFDRKIQAEREAEGDQFADKETFVTASYKQKLEEKRIAEEKARMEEALEEASFLSSILSFFESTCRDLTEGLMGRWKSRA